MTTSFTAFDSYKLNTQFSVDGTSFIHTIPETVPGGKVRVERWSRVERIGKGTFGSVYKEKCDNGDVRAVKVVLHSAMNIRELLALTRMTQVRKHLYMFDLYTNMRVLTHSTQITSSSCPAGSRMIRIST